MAEKSVVRVFGRYSTAIKAGKGSSVTIKRGRSRARQVPSSAQAEDHPASSSSGPESPSTGDADETDAQAIGHGVLAVNAAPSATVNVSLRQLPEDLGTRTVSTEEPEAKRFLQGGGTHAVGDYATAIAAGYKTTIIIQSDDSDEDEDITVPTPVSSDVSSNPSAVLPVPVQCQGSDPNIPSAALRDPVPGIPQNQGDGQNRPSAALRDPVPGILQNQGDGQNRPSAALRDPVPGIPQNQRDGPNNLNVSNNASAVSPDPVQNEENGTNNPSAALCDPVPSIPLSSDEPYNMDSGPDNNVGKVLIIVETEFSKWKEDLQKTRETCRKLGLEETVLKDANIEEVKSGIQSFVKSLQPYHSISALVAFNHGIEGRIICHDKKQLSIRYSVLKPFEAKSCKAMVNKPKLFFLDCCRGGISTKGVQSKEPAGAKSGTGLPDIDDHFHDLVGTTSAEPKSISDDDTTPENADFYVGYGASDGHKAWCDPKEGSFYINAVMDNLDKSAATKDLKTIMEDVSKEMATKQVNKTDPPSKQQPWSYENLRRKLYFKPYFDS